MIFAVLYKCHKHPAALPREKWKRMRYGRIQFDINGASDPIRAKLLDRHLV
jgi:hypothetical protein